VCRFIDVILELRIFHYLEHLKSGLIREVAFGGGGVA
jgi:hypothetical protein